MKECFCGCGRTIPKFPLGMRSVNKRGLYILDRLAWAHALHAEGWRTESFDLDDWFADGREFVVLYRRAMHGEVEAHPLVSEDVGGDWLAYGRNLDAAAAAHGLPNIAEWLAAGRPGDPSVGREHGSSAAAWFPDPHGRHELRYWDGEGWTEHVSDAGKVGQDAV